MGGYVNIKNHILVENLYLWFYNAGTFLLGLHFSSVNSARNLWHSSRDSHSADVLTDPVKMIKILPYPVSLYPTEWAYWGIFGDE